MNPIQSVTEWVEGVGHGNATQLYTSLVLEETKEVLESVGHRKLAIRRELLSGIGVLDGLSYTLRHDSEMLADRLMLLDAALDVAWVSLCLAHTLTGDKLPDAWAELHRSNVTAKQVDGRFIKDGTGKVRKPEGWTAPDLAQFLRRVSANA